MLEKFTDDDPLVFNVSSDAIGSKKIDPVGPVRFQIGPHPIEGRSIEQSAGVPVVNVLFGEHVPCDSDLSFQLYKLALNSSFFLLRVGAYAGVQCGSRSGSPLGLAPSSFQLSLLDYEPGLRKLGTESLSMNTNTYGASSVSACGGRVGPIAAKCKNSNSQNLKFQKFQNWSNPNCSTS